MRQITFYRETNWHIEIAHVASYDYNTIQRANNKDTDQTALMRGLICTLIFVGMQQSGFPMMRHR